MFYKSSILAAIFVLLSIGNAIAADLPAIENFIAEQQIALKVNDPHQKLSPSNNSASVAKARLTGISAEKLADDTNLKSSTNKSSASIAKARLHNVSAKESTNPQLTVPKSIDNSLTAPAATPSAIIAQNIAPASPAQPVDTVQHNQANQNTISVTNSDVLSQTVPQSNKPAASSELDRVKQWNLNKTIAFNNILQTPTDKPSLSNESIAQAPGSLTDNLILSTPTNIPQTIESQKPGISKPVSQTVEIKKIDPIKPISQIVETKKPENLKPAPQNDEPKKWAVGVHTQLSTTGFIGVDAGYKFNPNLHARLGLNAVGFNLDYTSQGIDYKAKFTPTNVHLLGDFFPFGGGLRLTGGLIFQGNQFNATGTPNSSALPTQISLGGTNYNLSDVGSVSSEGSFSNSVAPYLGIGFGTPLSSGLGFNFDAGVMFAGSAKVKLRANIPSSVDPTIQNNIRNSLAEQERITNNDIGSFGLYPVLSVGISYAF
jgi:hypothetical protein